ncbi:hypothetical protein EI94DRAFT_735144 [Lactarius quietus]|nr:hypothetical protein EI94DRAFT_735144 [Lactarius quietus]
MTDYCPVYAPFFGAMGCTSAIVFTCIGASYGTAKSGVGISAIAVLRPDLMMKSVVPVVMAGITGFVQLGAGLSVGLAGLAAGFAIGIVGDAGVRGTAQQPRLFVGMDQNVNNRVEDATNVPDLEWVPPSTVRVQFLPYAHFPRSTRSTPI